MKGEQVRTSGVVVSVGCQCGKIVEEVNGSRLASGKHSYFLSGAKDRIVLHHQTKQKHDRIHSENWVETFKAMQTTVA